MDTDYESWEALVSFIQSIGVLIAIAWLCLPVTALISNGARKRNRPGASLIFGRLTLITWGIVSLAMGWWFVTGRYYGEGNGEGPDQWDAIAVIIMLCVLLALHIALILAARGSPRFK